MTIKQLETLMEQMQAKHNTTNTNINKLCAKVDYLVSKIDDVL